MRDEHGRLEGLGVYHGWGTGNAVCTPRKFCYGVKFCQVGCGVCGVCGVRLSWSGEALSLFPSFPIRSWAYCGGIFPRGKEGGPGQTWNAGPINRARKMLHTPRSNSFQHQLQTTSSASSHAFLSGTVSLHDPNTEGVLAPVNLLPEALEVRPAKVKG